MTKLLRVMLAMGILLGLCACANNAPPNEPATQNSEINGEQDSLPGYGFVFQGVELVPGEPFAAEDFPEPQYSYTQTNSVLGGYDTFYNYVDVEITVHDDGKSAVSANDRYFGEAFGVKQTADGFAELSEEAHPTETMKSATGDIKTKAGDDGREDLAFEKLKRATIAEVETEETPAEETPAETNDKGSSSKKVATGVGIAAAIIALGVAIKKLFGGKDKKAKKAGFSKAKTPKAPKPSTAKAKTEAPAVKSEVKKEAKDFSKYLK